ncbi:MAG: PEP-CTERM sorting domain-containing protein [Planctomycetaceae bacterium]|nr:PEP-CTERM sorting domain-containing protein [Planctomycetaceae bacterium]
MKTATRAILAVAGILALAGAAQAATLTFETPDYHTGAIEGQDGWVAHSSPNPDAGIIAFTGPDGSAYTMGSLNTNRGYARRDDTDIIRSDNTITVSWLLRSGANSEVCQIRSYDFTSGAMGIGFGDSGGNSTTTKFQLFSATGAVYNSTYSFIRDHWYEVTIAIDVAANTATLSAYDVTAGAAVTGMELDNKSMNIAGADAAARQASLDALGALYASFGGGATRMDNLQYGDIIPEPATMSLLVLGAVGVIVRRKRS